MKGGIRFHANRQTARRETEHWYKSRMRKKAHKARMGGSQGMPGGAGMKPSQKMPWRRTRDFHNTK